MLDHKNQTYVKLQKSSKDFELKLIMKLCYVMKKVFHLEWFLMFQSAFHAQNSTEILKESTKNIWAFV